MDTYDKGDLVRRTVVFKNSAGTPTDPTDVTYKLTEPDGTVTVFEYNPGAIVKDSTGNFHVDITPDQVGTHSELWVGAGAVQQTDESTWFVRLTDF